MARVPRIVPYWPGLLLLSLTVLGALGMESCTSAYKRSIGGETEQVFARVYLTDFNTAWQSVLDSLKHARLDISNREAGFIQTKWSDNTAIKNMIDSFGTADAYLKAQYRFRVTVAQGSYEGRPGVKVSVYREQVVSRDVLEGFHPVETDGVDERTLLYRIGRIIYMRMKLALMEERRQNQAIQGSGGGDLEGDLGSSPAAPNVGGGATGDELNDSGGAPAPTPDSGGGDLEQELQ